MEAETLLSPYRNPTKGAPVRQLRTCELMMYKKLKEPSLFSLETRSLRGYNSCLPPSRRQRWTFSEVHNRSIGNRQKLQWGIWIEFGTKFFTLKVIKYWSRSTERLQSPSLKIFRTQQDIQTTWSKHEVIPVWIGGSWEDLQRFLSI